MAIETGYGWSDISQRNLNNAFAYDLVPSPGVITAALKAARRVNDFPTAVRIFEGTTTQWVFGNTTPQTCELILENRHQGKGRECTPISGILGGIEASAGRAGNSPQGGIVL